MLIYPAENLLHFKYSSHLLRFLSLQSVFSAHCWFKM